MSAQPTQYPVESGFIASESRGITAASSENDRLGRPISPTAEKNSAPRAWRAITDLCAARSLVRLVTPMMAYDSMLIEKAKAPVDVSVGRALRFEIELSEILGVNVSVTAATTTTPTSDRLSERQRGTVEGVPLQVVPDTRYDYHQERGVLIIIPIEDAAHQSLLIALGERRVRLSVWWQPSDAAWYLSVDTASGEGIARGRRLTADGVAVTAQGFGSNPDGWAVRIRHVRVGSTGRIGSSGQRSEKKHHRSSRPHPTNPGRGGESKRNCRANPPSCHDRRSRCRRRS